MTIIDKYITNNPSKPAEALAQEIGVSENFVRVRIASLDADGNKHKPNPSDEVTALLYLIQLRETGWAVDIAKERVAYLESLVK
jgi:hypothetical protein